MAFVIGYLILGLAGMAVTALAGTMCGVAIKFAFNTVGMVVAGAFFLVYYSLKFVWFPVSFCRSKLKGVRA